MLHIFVPSRDRHDPKYIARGPMAWFPPATLTYVVPEEQLELYQKSGVIAVPRPKSVTNVGLARLFIGQLADEWNYDKFMMVDDDLRFFVRKSPYDTKLRKVQEEDMYAMIATVDEWLDSYVQVGISARTGNNRTGPGKAPIPVRNTRTNGCTAYQTKAFLSVEHNRVPVMEDFDVSLQLIRKGYPNVCLFYWAYDQNMTNAPGGCSRYRTHELQDQAARELKRLHPEFVSLRQKRNKTDADGFGTRTEVTIQWKKAYERSVRI